MKNVRPINILRDFTIRGYELERLKNGSFLIRNISTICLRKSGQVSAAFI